MQVLPIEYGGRAALVPVQQAVAARRAAAAAVAAAAEEEASEDASSVGGETELSAEVSTSRITSAKRTLR